jgi:hypothetical protein
MGMELTNRSYSVTVRTFVPSKVTSPLFMKNYTNKILKRSYLTKNFLKIDRKISDFLQKYEPSMYKGSYI